MEKHLFELMVERKTRLVVEPSLVEPHVIIAVRDCNLGSKVQLFREIGLAPYQRNLNIIVLWIIRG